jgi:hypothetical protein
MKTRITLCHARSNIVKNDGSVRFSPSGQSFPATRRHPRPSAEDLLTFNKITRL